MNMQLPIPSSSDLMTIYFTKRTGSITDMCSGASDMSLYGEEAEDYAIIFDYVVLPWDNFVFSNPHQFIVMDGELKLNSKASLPKYL